MFYNVSVALQLTDMTKQQRQLNGSFVCSIKVMLPAGHSMLLPLLVCTSDNGACVSVCWQLCGASQQLHPGLPWVDITLVMSALAFRLACSQLPL